MIRRFTALLFILMVAGTVWAGVCGCFTGADGQVSSCCKRKVADKDTVSAKPCCEEDCSTAGVVNIPRTQTETSIKISLPSDVLVVDQLATFVLDHTTVRRVEVTVSFVDKRLNLPRPPNLYLKHHSFLI